MIIKPDFDGFSLDEEARARSSIVQHSVRRRDGLTGSVTLAPLSRGTWEANMTSALSTLQTRFIRALKTQPLERRFNAIFDIKTWCAEAIDELALLFNRLPPKQKVSSRRLLRVTTHVGFNARRHPMYDEYKVVDLEGKIVVQFKVNLHDPLGKRLARTIVDAVQAVVVEDEAVAIINALEGE